MLGFFPRPLLPARVPTPVAVSLTAIYMAHSYPLLQKSDFIQNLTIPGVQKVVPIASGETNSMMLLMFLSSLWD